MPDVLVSSTLRDLWRSPLKGVPGEWRLFAVA
jgi:hypothetical protein